jgi:hypothetical protein
MLLVFTLSRRRIRLWQPGQLLITPDGISAQIAGKISKRSSDLDFKRAVFKLPRRTKTYLDFEDSFNSPHTKSQLILCFSNQQGCPCPSQYGIKSFFFSEIEDGTFLVLIG